MTEFWKSTRFWALVILALVSIADTYGIMPAEIPEMFYIILGGHIGLRTIDKFGGNFGTKTK